MSWSALDRPFFFLAQTGAGNTLGGFISGTVGSFQSGGAFSGQGALTIECSLMSGCGQGCELVSGRSCGSSFQG